MGAGTAVIPPLAQPRWLGLYAATIPAKERSKTWHVLRRVEPLSHLSGLQAVVFCTCLGAEGAMRQGEHINAYCFGSKGQPGVSS